MTGRVEWTVLAIFLTSMSLHAGVAMADIPLPRPPDRGTVAADLPAPRSPTQAQWPLAVAGLSLLLLAGGIVGLRRRLGGRDGTTALAD